MPINVTRSSMPSLEEFVEEIRPIFESYHLTNMGPIHKKLQQQLTDYLGQEFDSKTAIKVQQGSFANSGHTMNC